MCLSLLAGDDLCRGFVGDELSRHDRGGCGVHWWWSGIGVEKYSGDVGGETRQENTRTHTAYHMLAVPTAHTFSFPPPCIVVTCSTVCLVFSFSWLSRLVSVPVGGDEIRDIEATELSRQKQLRQSKRQHRGKTHNTGEARSTKECAVCGWACVGCCLCWREVSAADQHAQHSSNQTEPQYNTRRRRTTSDPHHARHRHIGVRIGVAFRVRSFVDCPHHDECEWGADKWFRRRR